LIYHFLRRYICKNLSEYLVQNFSCFASIFFWSATMERTNFYVFIYQRIYLFLPLPMHTTNNRCIYILEREKVNNVSWLC
jgi:hypothetical protein